MRGIRLGCHRCPFHGILLAEHLDHGVQPSLHASVTRGRSPQLDALQRGSSAQLWIQTSAIVDLCSVVLLELQTRINESRHVAYRCINCKIYTCAADF